MNKWCSKGLSIIERRDWKVTTPKLLIGYLSIGEYVGLNGWIEAPWFMLMFCDKECTGENKIKILKNPINIENRTNIIIRS